MKHDDHFDFKKWVKDNFEGNFEVYEPNYDRYINLLGFRAGKMKDSDNCYELMIMFHIESGVEYSMANDTVENCLKRFVPICPCCKQQVPRKTEE